MKRAFLVAVALAFVLQHANRPVVAQQLDDLKFFKNFFITGDYRVAGVGLKNIVPVNGFSEGQIDLNDNPATPLVDEGVPRGADILAAYLYWQVVSDTGPDTGSLGVKFKGYNLTLPDDLTTVGVDPKPFAKVLAFAGTSACFNPGGGTGENGGSRKTYTYRMDVLRFFDVEGPTDLFPGKTKLVGPGVTHSISVPNFGGTSNQAPIALGASLVIIYRDTSKPLNGIVIYDDGVTLGNAQRTLDQSIAGFYQAADPPNATISYIVGSGDATKNEYVGFPPATIEPYASFTGGNQPNVFSGSSGAAWDNKTIPVNLATPNNVQSITARVSNNLGQRDCLTVAAMVFKTAVKDSDNDGLLDRWELATTPILDPNNKPLPLLPGANQNRKDLYIQIGYMDTNGAELSYGGGDPVVAHSHRPRHETLKLVGDTFKNAPITNLDSSTGIKVHFDLGTSYPTCPSVEDPGPCATEYIIGSSLATGSERVDEMSTVCHRDPDAEPPDEPWVCQYSEFPGTVGWKTGYRFIRDEVVSITPEPDLGDPPTSGWDDYCDKLVNPADPPATGTRYACTWRFNPNRRDMFRYVFFAHALGIPQSPDPESADFHVPITNTGIADFRGGDTLLTLGAFLDYDNVTPTGTPFQQAATMVHELGHQMGRRHNGDTIAPNCTPQYFSTMNYLYQLRGLVGTDGLPVIDLSRSDQPAAIFDELHLRDGDSHVSFPTPTTTSHKYPFRMSWYAPIAGPLADKPGVTRANRHCDGSIIQTGEPGFDSVRVDSGTLGAVDWDMDGVLETTADLPRQDINFDGLDDTGAFTLKGSADWASLELNQLGSRRSPGGYFYDLMGELTIGPLSLGGGKGDLGSGDLSEYALGGGKGDLGGGKGDLGGGKGDLGGGKGDLGGGKGDLGVGTRDLLGGGKGDLGGGKGDLGLGDEGGGDTFGDEGEIDETLASDLTRVPPNAVTACQNCGGIPTNYVRVSWVAPTVGGILRYTVYRALIDATTGQTGEWTQLLTPGIEDPPGTVVVPAEVGVVNRNFSWVDPDSHRLVAGSRYAYQVTATYMTSEHGPLESNGSSPDAVIGATVELPNGVAVVNSNPTIDNVPPAQNILRGTSTGDLVFTVGDIESFAPISELLPNGAATPNDLDVTFSKSSTNAALRDATDVQLTGTGPTRMVRVTHSGLTVGTVTIQLIVKDTQCSDPNETRGESCPRGTVTASFNVNVFQYAMVGVTNVPPAVTVPTVQRSKNITFGWTYTEGATTTVVDSPTVVHQVVVTGPPFTGPASNPVPTTRTYTSGFQYQSNSKTWRFTLTTKDGNVAFPAGAFSVTIKSTTPAGFSPKTFPLAVTP